MSTEGGAKLAEGMAVTVHEMDPAVMEWMTHVSSHFAVLNELLAKAPDKVDPRSINLARTHLETSSLWIGNSINVLIVGVGAAHRKPEN